MRRLMIGLAALLATPLIVNTQTLDICGCATIPDLRPFDSRDPSTHPPGTTVSGDVLTLPLPPDGILRFSSFLVSQRHVRFQRNAANTGATLLVAGDVTLDSPFCCYTMSVSGDGGTRGTSSHAGAAGLGGAGGFRGGDGANKAIYGSGIGGTGLGPGGGRGGVSDVAGECANTTGAGEFFGAPELVPLMGGGGGGGGCSTSLTTFSCSGGGGGGGGGAVLIAANGAFSMRHYFVLADGGPGGTTDNSSCAAGGAGGSGGAIRVVAGRLVYNGGFAELNARGGGGSPNSPGGGPGRVRLETVDASALTTFATDPPALRIVGPTPLANPLSPSVRITAVGGSASPAVPQGGYGSIDIVVAVPGLTTVDFETTGVPGGTSVEVIVKPRVGAAAISQVVPLTTCDSTGACQGTTSFNLAGGAYVVEARATFQVS